MVRDFWSLALLGFVIFVAEVGMCEEMSIWAREDGTGILTVLDDIV